MARQSPVTRYKASMDSKFFDSLQIALASERLDAYRQDGANSLITLARYLRNMALCESLYSPLQMAEIALRNALQRGLATRFSTQEWYDDRNCWTLLSDAQREQIDEAKTSLASRNKPVTPGRVVAELTFGFWTAFFNKRFAQNSVVIHLATTAFQAAPKSERDILKLNRRWQRIRNLRNRVFHHERIIHWADLNQQHEQMLETVRWLSPDLHEMASVLDRFTEIRTAGEQPWIDKIKAHWPAPAQQPATGEIGTERAGGVVPPPTEGQA